MKIKVLNDYYDGKRKIFSKGEVVEIIKQSKSMIYVKEKYRQIYCFYKTDEGKEYEIIKEE